MASNNARTITDDTNDRNDRKNENDKFRSDNFEKTIKSKNDKTFQVKNYRDYNVFSDVENILNLNPVSYLDDVKPTQNVYNNSKTFNINAVPERTTKSLTTSFNNLQPPSISTIVRTASHIIGPPPPMKPPTPAKRRPVRDDSDINYLESVALNEGVHRLFGDKKTVYNQSASKIVFI